MTHKSTRISQLPSPYPWISMEYFELGELGHVNYISRVIHIYIYIHIELNYRTIFRVIQSYIHRLELHLIIPLKKKTWQFSSFDGSRKLVEKGRDGRLRWASRGLVHQRCQLVRGRAGRVWRLSPQTPSKKTIPLRRSWWLDIPWI